MQKGIPWDPVRPEGCGDRECPLCKAKIALGIEAEHRRKVASTGDTFDQVTEWAADAYGTGADRGAHVITPEERKAARGDRNRALEQVRVVRSFSPKDDLRAQDIVAAIRPKQAYLRKGPRDERPTKNEWLSEVWLELLNPSALAASREKHITLEVKISRAVNRAQKIMRKDAARAAGGCP